MNRAWMPVLLATGIVGAFYLVNGCADSTPDAALPLAPVAAPPARQAWHPAPLPAPLPSRPQVTQWQKPKSLGPPLPAVVAVPAAMEEPVIRVKITGEHASPPVLTKKYHGRVEILRLPDGNYVAINTLGIESYLMGVLSREMYGSWDIEAYKAQAIAARTYALYQLRTSNKNTQWDVNADESSQMYGGVAGETRKSRAAVGATRGMVLETTAANGQSGIFCAFYSACSGGATQDPFDAWGDASVGPLAGHRVGDVEEGCPKFRWGAVTVEKSEITRVLRAWGQKNQEPAVAGIGMVRSVNVVRRHATTGRPVELRITDDGGRQILLRAEEFRIALLNDPLHLAPKPPSSFCDYQDAGSAIVLANGRGYGHGIGMSQWGAQALALRGVSGEDILRFYYPGSVIRPLW